jgi:hypothetical protein
MGDNAGFCFSRPNWQPAQRGKVQYAESVSHLSKV